MKFFLKENKAEGGKRWWRFKMTTTGRKSNGKQGGSGPRVTMVSMSTSLCRVILLLLLFYHPLMAWASAVTPIFNKTSSKSNSSQVDYYDLPEVQIIPDHVGFNTIDISSSSNSAATCGHLRAEPPISISTATNISVKLRRDVDHEEDDKKVLPLKLHLKRRSNPDSSTSSKKSNEELLLKESLRRDLSRIQTLQKRIAQKKQQNGLSRRKLMQLQQHQLYEFKRSMTLEIKKQEIEEEEEEEEEESSSLMMMKLESGFSQGSGEYFTDVYVGTPPLHFSLILDTGSDLNWIQCLPCHDCFEQNGPYYDPKQSTSYRNVSCADERCSLVAFPNPPESCRSNDQTCPYFYWYGDRSNTTGDLALETFTINMTTTTLSEITKQKKKHARGNVRVVENVIFGCGHWNRGLFHGAAGLLGLGRGPLSFASQLRSLYGSTFSYCLVDRNKDGSISSKLILGEDKNLMAHHDLNFTDFVQTKTENDNKDVAETTFYYVGIKGILVGGEMLAIQPETWELSDAKKEDSGGRRRRRGTIIDSGTTLSYFVEPAYSIIKDAFVKKLGDMYPKVKGIFPVPLEPCYNISGVAGGSVDMPEFAILFKDGAVWNFPPENYFIALEEGLICLAILGTPPSSPSILGNYLQQNFHVLYDINRSRLGFAPTDCANL